jgi:predicted metallopeptidase
MRMVSQIKYCAFQASTTLGYAGDNIIWLSTKLDTYSVDEICKIIIEEQEHITSGFGDETRNFQNHLFNLYFNELTR